MAEGTPGEQINKISWTLSSRICQRHRLKTPPTGSTTARLERHRLKLMTNVSSQQLENVSFSETFTEDAEKDSFAHCERRTRLKFEEMDSRTRKEQHPLLGQLMPSMQHHKLTDSNTTGRHRVLRNQNRGTVSVEKSTNHSFEGKHYPVSQSKSNFKGKYLLGSTEGYSMMNPYLQVANHFPPGRVIRGHYRNRFHPSVSNFAEGGLSDSMERPTFQLIQAQRAHTNGTVHLEQVLDRKRRNYATHRT